MKGSHKRQLVQHKVIEALAAGASIPEAADAGGVHASTVYRWLDRPGFTEALSRAKGEGPDERESHGARAYREAKEEAAGLTFAQAHQHEETRWPSWRLRWAFWNREDVPAELRERQRPDPRRVLTVTTEKYGEIADETEAFERARIEWLEATVSGG